MDTNIDTPRTSTTAQPTTRRRRLGVGLAAGAAGLAVLASAAIAPVAAQADTGTPITRSHVLARAKVWFDDNVQYSQSATHDGAFGDVPYRTDCSGFVSMAWRITSATGLSAPNTNALATSTYTTKLANKANLQPGDILDEPGVHTVLFEKWANDAHTSIWLYEEANPSEDMNHYTAPLSKYADFGAYRYKNITDG